MGKRRRAEASLDNLPEEERERRRAQRKAREEALAARAVGEDYVPARKRRSTAERAAPELPPAPKPAPAGGAGGQPPARHGKGRQAANATERKPRPAPKAPKAAGASSPPVPQVVIVPIYWKARKEEKLTVIRVCQAAEETLVASGIVAQVDHGLDRTPGQKFAYWEHRGVLVRVEVGPREAAKGCCVLARCERPGTPALRRPDLAVADDGALVATVRAVLDAEPLALEAMRPYEGPVQRTDQSKPAKGAEEEGALALAVTAHGTSGDDQAGDELLAAIASRRASGRGRGGGAGRGKGARTLGSTRPDQAGGSQRRRHKPAVAAAIAKEVTF